MKDMEAATMGPRPRLRGWERRSAGMTELWPQDKAKDMEAATTT